MVLDGLVDVVEVDFEFEVVVTGFDVEDDDFTLLEELDVDLLVDVVLVVVGLMLELVEEVVVLELLVLVRLVDVDLTLELVVEVELEEDFVDVVTDRSVSR